MFITHSATAPQVCFRASVWSPPVIKMISPSPSHCLAVVLLPRLNRRRPPRPPSSFPALWEASAMNAESQRQARIKTGLRDSTGDRWGYDTESHPNKDPKRVTREVKADE